MRARSILRALRGALPLAALLVLGIAPGGTLLGFDGGSGWLNSGGLTPADLRGKVVLVDFWEYTCVNCIRTFPYLREWYRRYAKDGFAIVGVHTPEFGFSGEESNVAAAAKRMDLTWPIVLDDNFAIWNRYKNAVWPHEFLFDRSGRLVDDFAGEGGYPQTEAQIQSLLKQGDPSLSLPPVMPLLPQDNYAKPGAVCYPDTAETIVEHAQIGDPVAFAAASQDGDYVDRGTHKDGTIYLSGYWHRTSQAIASGGNDGHLSLVYHAVQVVAVMRASGAGAIRVDVTQDDKPISREDAGSDIHYDASGRSYVSVDSARAYELVMNARFGSHALQLTPEHYGLKFYSFAFESCEVPGAG